ncbi:MAG TPA: DUF1987 domain-containing protein [Bacteroidales bacterium]|nr:DUF1987 domain-containing protein [Bacteroidales bacterium]
MKNLHLEATGKTPYVNFDAKTGNLEILGRIIPENSAEFYRPLLEWLQDYSKQAAPETKVRLHLEYFNTASSYLVVKLFKAIEAIEKLGSKVTIYWYFDDEDMYEAGEDFESIIKVNFEYIAVDED